MSTELKRIIEQNEVIINLLAEIADDLGTFREFVLEVTPKDAREEINSVK